MRLGALEAGGTKMVCAIGNENGEIFERISIPTVTLKLMVISQPHQSWRGQIAILSVLLKKH